ncbi:hypothetical protein FVE85_5945 [Porphyridium purpureum]|uniref:B-block binding subunit of TFIIIC domain-containing protein n=1 Tax=Porphyridium purpureum TaxID=35688 RepID=A0A5J4Z557_PORPP|nr:hypothetical protein FVE85_5945 [Porphyridium purpureum]|eukprot:POR1996..scf295_1
MDVQTVRMVCEYAALQGQDGCEAVRAVRAVICRDDACVQVDELDIQLATQQVLETLEERCGLNSPCIAEVVRNVGSRNGESSTDEDIRIVPRPEFRDLVLGWTAHVHMSRNEQSERIMDAVAKAGRAGVSQTELIDVANRLPAVEVSRLTWMLAEQNMISRFSPKRIVRAGVRNGKQKTHHKTPGLFPGLVTNSWRLPRFEPSEAQRLSISNVRAEYHVEKSLLGTTSSKASHKDHAYFVLDEFLIFEHLNRTLLAKSYRTPGPVCMSKQEFLETYFPEPASGTAHKATGFNADFQGFGEDCDWLFMHLVCRYRERKAALSAPPHRLRIALHPDSIFDQLPLIHFSELQSLHFVLEADSSPPSGMGTFGPGQDVSTPTQVSDDFSPSNQHRSASSGAGTTSSGLVLGWCTSFEQQVYECIKRAPAGGILAREIVAQLNAPGATLVRVQHVLKLLEKYELDVAIHKVPVRDDKVRAYRYLMRVQTDPTSVLGTTSVSGIRECARTPNHPVYQDPSQDQEHVDAAAALESLISPVAEKFYRCGSKETTQSVELSSKFMEYFQQHRIVGRKDANRVLSAYVGRKERIDSKYLTRLLCNLEKDHKIKSAVHQDTFSGKEASFYMLAEVDENSDEFLQFAMKSMSEKRHLQMSTRCSLVLNRNEDIRMIEHESGSDTSDTEESLAHALGLIRGVYARAKALHGFLCESFSCSGHSTLAAFLSPQATFSFSRLARLMSIRQFFEIVGYYGPLEKVCALGSIDKPMSQRMAPLQRAMKTPEAQRNISQLAEILCAFGILERCGGGTRQNAIEILPSTRGRRKFDDSVEYVYTFKAHLKRGENGFARDTVDNATDRSDHIAIWEWPQAPQTSAPGSVAEAVKQECKSEALTRVEAFWEAVRSMDDSDRSTELFSSFPSRWHLSAWAEKLDPYEEDPLPQTVRDDIETAFDSHVASFEESSSLSRQLAQSSAPSFGVTLPILPLDTVKTIASVIKNEESAWSMPRILQYYLFRVENTTISAVYRLVHANPRSKTLAAFLQDCACLLVEGQRRLREDRHEDEGESKSRTILTWLSVAKKYNISERAARRNLKRIVAQHRSVAKLVKEFIDEVLLAGPNIKREEALLLEILDIEAAVSSSGGKPSIVSPVAPSESVRKSSSVLKQQEQAKSIRQQKCGSESDARDSLELKNSDSVKQGRRGSKRAKLMGQHTSCALKSSPLRADGVVRDTPARERSVPDPPGSQQAALIEISDTLACTDFDDCTRTLPTDRKAAASVRLDIVEECIRALALSGENPLSKEARRFLRALPRTDADRALKRLKLCGVLTNESSLEPDAECLTIGPLSEKTMKELGIAGGLEYDLPDNVLEVNDGNFFPTSLLHGALETIATSSLSERLACWTAGGYKFAAHVTSEEDTFRVQRDILEAGRAQVPVPMDTAQEREALKLMTLISGAGAEGLVLPVQHRAVLVHLEARGLIAVASKPNLKCSSVEIEQNLFVIDSEHASRFFVSRSFGGVAPTWVLPAPWRLPFDSMDNCTTFNKYLKLLALQMKGVRVRISCEELGNFLESQFALSPRMCEELIGYFVQSQRKEHGASAIEPKCMLAGGLWHSAFVT